MSGIHVSNVSDEVTEKGLKVHFSNPRHGGGPVTKVFYPLPRRSAVVLFQNPADVEKVAKTDHRLDEEQLVVTPLPKRVYSTVSAEVDRSASLFMSTHKNVVDELQFLGELGVDFSYEREAYILTGNWYQLEWALFYLDRTLDAYGVDIDAKKAVQTRRISHENRDTKTNPRDVRTRDKEQEKKRTHEIKNPNIPRKPMEIQEKNTDARKPIEGKGKYKDKPQDGLQAIDHGEHVRKYVDKKLTKNKNAAPLLKERTTERSSGYSGASGVGRPGAAGGNRGSYHGGRSLTFSPETNFEENKPRPHRMQPPMTNGLDISMADFGDVPLSYEFEIGRDLKVRILKGDITKQTTDAIVNPTTHNLMSHYGVSRAIMMAAGNEVYRDCLKHVEEHGDLETTEVIHTSAGGALSPSMSALLHVVGPVWNEEDSESSTHHMVCTYLNCFMYADKLWLKSVATPLISAGAFGFPLDVCLQAFYDALLLFSRRQSERRHLQEIILVCFDMDSVMASISIIQSLLDCELTMSTNAAAERYNIQAMTTNCSVSDFRMSTRPKATEKNKNATAEKKVDDSEAEVSTKPGSQDKMDEEKRADAERVGTTDAHGLDKELGNARSTRREMDSQEVKPFKRANEHDTSRTEGNMSKGDERLQQTRDMNTSNELRNDDSAHKKGHEKDEDDDLGEEDFKAANAALKTVFDNDEEEGSDVEVGTACQDKKITSEDNDGSEDEGNITDEHAENENDPIESSERGFVPAKYESTQQQQGKVSLECSDESEDDEPFMTSLHSVKAKAADADLEDGDVAKLKESELEASLSRDADPERRTEDEKTEAATIHLRHVGKGSVDDEPPSDWSIIQRPDCEGDEEEEEERDREQKLEEQEEEGEQEEWKASKGEQEK